MRKKIEIYEPDVINNQKITPFIRPYNFQDNNSRNIRVIKTLKAEGCDDFVNYIEWLGLSKDPDMLVLSSMHHYFYDAEEMKKFKSVISLKELNQIQNVKTFLHSIFHILPKRSYFIGCFNDNKKHNGFHIRKSFSSDKNKTNSEAVENGIISRNPFMNMLYSLLDSRTNNFLSRASVSSLISDHGFKVLDMTELNGLTYFCAQNLRTSEN